MRNDVLAVMKAKGIDTPEAALEELMRSGVLTGFDLSKYLALNEFMRLSCGVEKPMGILKDVAFRYNIATSTLYKALPR